MLYQNNVHWHGVALADSVAVAALAAVADVVLAAEEDSSAAVAALAAVALASVDVAASAAGMTNQPTYLF